MSGKKTEGPTIKRQEWKTAANLVTITRIVLIPIFVVLILSPWPNLFTNSAGLNTAKAWVACGFFALLACTDGLDGYLARSRNEVTTMGKFLDPIADKLLVVAALLALIELGQLPSWVALIIIAREFLVSGLRMVVAAEGVVIAASWIGKWKTAVTIVALAMFIVMQALPSWFNVCAWIVMTAALALTIWSMIDYFWKSAPVLGLK